MWADPKSIDLIRVEVVTDDIPAHVPIKESTTSIEYSRLKIGEGEFLLPTGAEMVMIDLKGKEDRNRTEFSGCRQYSGESTISFAEAPEPGTAPPTRETVGVELPIGLEFTAYLDVALNAQTAIGDEVKATIQQTVKKSKVTVVPKGATLTGRVVSMLPANNAVLVGIDFQTLEFPGARAAVNPKLTGVGEFTAARVNSRNAQYALYDGPPMPGAKRAPAAMFYVRGSRLNIPAGLRMAFRLDKPENKKLEESK